MSSVVHPRDDDDMSSARPSKQPRLGDRADPAQPVMANASGAAKDVVPAGACPGPLGDTVLPDHQPPELDSPPASPRLTNTGTDPARVFVPGAVQGSKRLDEYVFDPSMPGLFQGIAMELAKRYRKAVESKTRQEAMLNALKQARDTIYDPPADMFPFFRNLTNLPVPSLPEFVGKQDDVKSAIGRANLELRRIALKSLIEVYTLSVIEVKKAADLPQLLKEFERLALGRVEEARWLSSDIDPSILDGHWRTTRGFLARWCQEFQLDMVGRLLAKQDLLQQKASAVNRAKDTIRAEVNRGDSSVEKVIKKAADNAVDKRLKVAPKPGKPGQKQKQPTSAPKASTSRPAGKPTRTGKSSDGNAKDKGKSGSKKKNVGTKVCLPFHVGRPSTYPDFFLGLNLAEQVKFVVLKSSMLWLDTLITNNTVHLLTKQPIATDVVKALSLNYKFIPRPKPFPVHVAHQQWTDFARRLRFRYQYQSKPNKEFLAKYWIPRPEAQPKVMPGPYEFALNLAKLAFDNLVDRAARMPAQKPNLSRSKLRSLRRVFDDNNVMVLPTDKNLGLCIVDSEWYINEGRKTLGDTHTYELCEFNPEQALQEYQAVLHRMRVADPDCLRKQEWDWLTAPNLAQASHLPTLKLLPKIHKSPATTRPIIPTFGTLLSNASIWVDHQLQPLIPKFPWILKDSKTFCRELLSLELEQGKSYWLITGDVVSMYPSIPTNVGVQRMAHLLQTDAPRTRGRLNLETIKDRKSLTVALLRLILTRNFVQFEGRTYLQRAGTAMGTSLAPAYANLFMASFEKDLLPKMHNVTFYRRYIDDMFAVIEGSLYDVMRFQENMKALHPSLKFTWEFSRETLPFLDVEVQLHSRQDSACMGRPRLATAPYQKRLNAYLYIPWTSYHPTFVKRSFVKGELIRYVRLCSEYNSFVRIAKSFRARLRARGYPPRWLDKIFLEVDWFERRATSLLPKSSIPGPAPIIFKASYNPLWDRMDFAPVWKLLREEFAPLGLISAVDRIVLSRKRAASLGDLVNTSNKRTLKSLSVL